MVELPKLCIACNTELGVQYIQLSDTYYRFCKNSGNVRKSPCPRYGLVTTVAIVFKSETQSETIMV